MMWIDLKYVYLQLRMIFMRKLAYGKRDSKDK